MKVMFVSNNPKYKYDEIQTGWNLLPSLFVKKRLKVLGIGKYELYKFYFKYLKFKPDLIVAEWVPAACIPILFKKLGFVKCPVVLNWGDYYAEMMTCFPKKLVKMMEDFSVRNADYITTVSKFNEERAKKLGKVVFYIPHGFFGHKKKTKMNLDKLKTKKNNLKIVYLGEQSKWKKVDKMINAVEGLDCDLFLIGKPNSEFRKIAGKNVHFIGYVDRLEVWSLLKQADILVNPSNQDCNYKLFEYIAVGKPILAYDGLPKYIFTHKKTAYLTKNFRAGLAELMNNKRLRKRLEKNVKKIKTFTWEEIADKYIRLFKKLTKS